MANSKNKSKQNSNSSTKNKSNHGSKTSSLSDFGIKSNSNSTGVLSSKNEDKDQNNQSSLTLLSQNQDNPESSIILIQDPEKKIYGPAHNSVINIPGTDDWYIVLFMMDIS